MDKVHTTRLGVNVPSIAALRSVMEISEYQCTLDATGMPSGYQIFYSRKREIHTANSIWTLSTGKVVISMVGHDGSTNRSGCNMESDRRFEFRPPPPNWSAMRQGINMSTNCGIHVYHHRSACTRSLSDDQGGLAKPCRARSQRRNKTGDYQPA